MKRWAHTNRGQHMIPRWGTYMLTQVLEANSRHVLRVEPIPSSIRRQYAQWISTVRHPGTSIAQAGLSLLFKRLADSE